MLQLRIERIRRGWSQTRVTMLTGISQSDISAIENGNRVALPGWRKRLATAFEMSEEQLFVVVSDQAAVRRP